MRPIKLSAKETERVDYFLDQFSKETPEIRDNIVRNLPSYNILHNLHAKSFEEFSLLSICREKGLPYSDPLFDFSNVLPFCPFGGAEHSVRRIGDNKYYCSDCEKKFAANWKSISSGSKCSSLVWMKVLHCMLNFYSIEKSIAYCGIARETYYYIRTRLFYAMQVLLDEVKLYGNIQVDILFSKISFKGTDLKELDYPEGSLYDEVAFIPRPARARGGHYSNKEKYKNNLCIFAAIDEIGHIFTKFVCIGPATAKRLKDAIPEEKILLNVPAKDPFSLFPAKATSKFSEPGTPSLIISDGEHAIKKYAEDLGVSFENHVYRRNGKQMQLSVTAHNIQKVNALHKRLRDFLRKMNYVSSKYLPGMLIFFDFIENTGASEEAIRRLFEILSRPGFGRSSSFFDELFTVPNYMIQWAADDHPLKGFTEDQLSAVYQYYIYLQTDNNQAEPLTVNRISETTGYSPTSIRRLYKNVCSSGLLELVIKHFDEMPPSSKKEKKSYGVIPAVYFEMYDDLIHYRTLPSSERPKMVDIWKAAMKKYNLDLPKSTYRFYMNRISEIKTGKKLPPMSQKTKEEKIKNHIIYYDAFMALVEKKRKANISFTSKSICVELAEVYNLSPDTLEKYISEIKTLKINENKTKN